MYNNATAYRSTATAPPPTYEELRVWYPAIDDWFALVADSIHAGASPEMALHRPRKQARGKITAIAHRRTVIYKLEQFAAAVEAIEQKWEGTAMDSGRKPKSPGQPARCPVCGSIDTNGAVCRHCHSAVT